MTTAEEAEQERSVFEDVEDFDDDDDDDSEDDDDGDGGQAHPPPHPPPPSQSQQAPPAGDLIPSAPAPAPANPNPIASDPAPHNGAIPVQVLSLSVSTSATSSDAALFTPSHSCCPLPVSVASASEDRKPFAVVAFDESRRLFQRLWSDEEEIKILQGFLEFTSKRGTTFASHQYDTGPFYEEIKKQLQFEFTKNQLIEKLRRLKKKYRNCVSRMRSPEKDFAFKSTHERAIYDIARNIWSANVKRAHESDDEDLNTPSNAVANEIFTVPINEGSFGSDRRVSRSRRRSRRRITEEAAAAAVAAAGGVGTDNSTPVVNTSMAPAAGIPDIIEETVKSCLSPLFKEMINSTIGGALPLGLNGGTSPLNLLPLSIGGGSLVGPGAPEDDKWRKQQILELEVYLKRIELVRDHVKSTLEELRSAGS